MGSEFLALCRRLDAFIYDATVLEYLVGQDSECVLLTVGSWFAMTGYGVGFPRHSKFRDLVNQQLMEYRENGKIIWGKANGLKNRPILLAPFIKK
jgi:ionotropic glutamate receptor NMDA 2B